MSVWKRQLGWLLVGTARRCGADRNMVAFRCRGHSELVIGVLVRDVVKSKHRTSTKTGSWKTSNRHESNGRLD